MMLQGLFNSSCSYEDTDFTNFDTSKLIRALNLALFFNFLQEEEHCQWITETGFQWVD